MSITAHLFVLFKHQPSEARLEALAETLSNRVGLPARDFTQGYERLKPVDDADLRADIHEDGALHYRSELAFQPLDRRRCAGCPFGIRRRREQRLVTTENWKTEKNKAHTHDNRWFY